DPYRCHLQLAGAHCRRRVRHAVGASVLGTAGPRKEDLGDLSIASERALRATRDSVASRQIQLGFLNGATSIPAAFSAARTPRAISTAPGVSPWIHTVSVRILITLPVTETTAPSCTIRTTRSAIALASCSTAPGFLRDTRLPSSS